jgi:hypothetical protein
MELPEHLELALRNPADTEDMTSTTLDYNLGRAGDLDAERPTIADLQRAQAHALAAGDRRRAAAYALVIRHRVQQAQFAAVAHAA